ncbi:MAG: ATP-dependent helicase, partial [bacterium]
KVTSPLLAESCQAIGFRGRPASPVWLATAEVEDLLEAHPDADVTPQQATQFVSRVLEAMRDLTTPLNEIARQEAGELLAAHQRVRSAARLTGVRYEVQPQLPPDVLGIYVLLPVA